MSVVSFARIAGLTPVPAKAPLWTRRSRFEADVSMTSTMSCSITAFIESMNSARVRKPLGGPVVFTLRPDGVKAGAHVGILGVGDDEIGAPIRAGANPREFFVEPQHASSHSRAAARLLIARRVRSATRGANRARPADATTPSTKSLSNTFLNIRDPDHAASRRLTHGLGRRGAGNAADDCQLDTVRRFMASSRDGFIARKAVKWLSQGQRRQP